MTQEMDSSRQGPRPRVMICDPIAEEGVALLREHADVDERTGLSPEELLQAIADYEAIVVRSATKVRQPVLERAINLKVIGRAGAGLDNIDVAFAQERGIAVVNSPDANTLAVAEHTMGLLLSLARRLPRADSSLKEGKWEKKQLMGTGLSGKTLGIIGFGRIGREVAVRAQAFGMRILVNQRRPTPELNLAANVTAVDLLDLLRESDFVTLHVPKTPQTTGMISTEQLKLMKPTAYVINTARGGVIDEEALLAALNEGVIAGAALDVFVKEPATHSELARHERVIATPHIAASTKDAQRAAAMTVATQIIELLAEVEVETLLPLRVVSMEQILPHENVDPRRVSDLAVRIEADGVLQNPPIVMEAGEQYLVLDGVTRIVALQQLACPDVVVQVIADESELDLHTWHHVLQEAGADDLVQKLSALPHVTLDEVEREKAADAMFEYGGLCCLHLANGRSYVVYVAAGVNRLDALNQLVATYTEAARIDRTITDDLAVLQQQYPDMSALVIYPQYTVSQVIQATQSGERTFPAGVTRFLVNGRVLRANVELQFLQAEGSLQEKNRWLQEMLLAKQEQGQIRFYAESVYVLDD